MSRQASMTRAFRHARSRAVSLPIPVFAPVMMTVLPVSKKRLKHWISVMMSKICSLKLV